MRGSGEWSVGSLASGAGAQGELMRAYRVGFIADVVIGMLACPWSSIISTACLHKLQSR